MPEEEVRKKYQKRHYIVEAVQWFPGMIIEDVIEINGHARLIGPNGGKLINQGDWIIFHEDSREEVKPDKDFNEQYEVYHERDNTPDEWGPFSFKQNEINQELTRIRENLENKTYVVPKCFTFLPKGINSITDYLAEEEKKEWRELEVQDRIKKGDKQ